MNARGIRQTPAAAGLLPPPRRLGAFDPMRTPRAWLEEVKAIFRVNGNRRRHLKMQKRLLRKGKARPKFLVDVLRREPLGQCTPAFPMWRSLADLRTRTVFRRRKHALWGGFRPYRAVPPLASARMLRR